MDIVTHPSSTTARFFSSRVSLWGLLTVANTPLLLLGDLNVTPWNHHFKKLLRHTGLKDSTQGYGVQPTWPTYYPWLWIPIDHCLYSSSIHVVGRKVGEHVGSDHYPVIIDFAIKSRSE